MTQTLWRMALVLAIAVIHTTVTPWIMPTLRGYDPLLALVVVLGLSDPPFRGLVVVAWAGVLMDNLSGVSFGFHLTIYLWGIVGVRAGGRFLYALNRLLPPLLVVVLVVIQNTVALLLASESVGERWLLVTAIQSTVAFITAPLVLDLIAVVMNTGDRWILAFSAGRRETSGIPRGDDGIR